MKNNCIENITSSNSGAATRTRKTDCVRRCFFQLVGDREKDQFGKKCKRYASRSTSIKTIQTIKEYSEKQPITQQREAHQNHQRVLKKTTNYSTTPNTPKNLGIYICRFMTCISSIAKAFTIIPVTITSILLISRSVIAGAIVSCKIKACFLLHFHQGLDHAWPGKSTLMLALLLSPMVIISGSYISPILLPGFASSTPLISYLLSPI